MRFPGFSSPDRGLRSSFRLSGPLGEQRVVLVADQGRLRLRSKAGEVGVAAAANRRRHRRSPARGAR